MAPEPMSEEELAAFKEEMAKQREQLHEALAEDLGGDPEDYRVDRSEIPTPGDE